MTKQEIVASVQKLTPPGSYVLFGSCSLAALNLREANDIDMLVSEDLFEELKSSGWKQIYKGPKDEPVTYDAFEAHSSWGFSPYSPTLGHLLSSAVVIEAVPFAALEEVRKWKQGRLSTKDIRDIKLIDNYLASQ
ncbi:hypothetical protein HYX70_04005 [Candidatus Saccharibacteria bacterium]|nr:hypothetical protein [Candidatus Saccharibacteria bacterium]